MEKVYDEQMAPKLMDIGKLYEENGIPFLAVAEYAPGKEGEHLCSQTSYVKGVIDGTL